MSNFLLFCSTSMCSNTNKSRLFSWMNWIKKSQRAVGHITLSFSRPLNFVSIIVNTQLYGTHCVPIRMTACKRIYLLSLKSAVAFIGLYTEMTNGGSFVHMRARYSLSWNWIITWAQETCYRIFFKPIIFLKFLREFWSRPVCLFLHTFVIILFVREIQYNIQNSGFRPDHINVNLFVYAAAHIIVKKEWLLKIMYVRQRIFVNCTKMGN